MKEEISNCALIIVLVSVCILTLYVVHVNRPKSKMIKIEFKQPEGDQVTIWTDASGIVKKANKNGKFWKDQVVISPQFLKAGSEMVIYSVYTDTINRNKFLVTQIEQED